VQSCVPAWPAGAARSAAARDARRSGELVVVVDGRRVSVDVSILWSGDSAFVADFVGPFGSPLATVESGPAGLNLVTGGRVQPIDPAQNVDEIVDFVRSPFTFGDFIRILTGEYAAAVAPQKPADSLVAGRRRATGVWLSDSVRARVVARTRDCATVESVLETRGGVQWQLRLSEWRDGIAGRSEFLLDERNYFVLTFK
jgi:hypothetical protein